MSKIKSLLIVCVLAISIIIIPELNFALDYSMNSSLANSTASFLGEASGDRAGTAVAIVGDVNGDGYHDIAIGAPDNDQGGGGSGKTYLIFGNSSGWALNINLTKANASFIGEGSGEGSGNTLAGAGDVNGDGYDDILIGAENWGTLKGAVYLILGKSSGWGWNVSLTNADASYRGFRQTDYVGSSIAGVGDVNGDGYDDFLIGGYGNEDFGPWRGHAYLVYGKASGWAKDISVNNVDASFYGESDSDQFGYSVSGAGDVNGDGYDDLLFGALDNDENGQYTGQTYLLYGKASKWTWGTNIATVANASFMGVQINEHTGTKVSGAGDVNGDGYDDFLIGAQYAGTFQDGRTYLVLGKASGLKNNTKLSSADASFIAENTGDRASFGLSGAGDVNGDGYDDFLIGAPRESTNGNNAGETYLILGKSSGWTTDVSLSKSDASFLGEAAGWQSGYSVDGGGDVNGDGYDDIVIGTSAWAVSSGCPGRAYLIFPDKNTWPSTVDSVKAYSDPGLNKLASIASINDTITTTLL